MGIESHRKASLPESKEQDSFDIEDHSGTPYYPLLRKVPRGLVSQHIQKIERDNLSPEKAVIYLESVLSKRVEALTTTVVSEPRLESVFRNSPEILKSIETSVFTNEDNFLGSGTTAKVKRLDVVMSDNITEKIAVKYVVHPTEKTLSASGEHDAIREVELLTKLEDLEAEEHIDKDIIRVPHPFFHHTTDKLQCYGMECIDGVNLQEALEGGIDDDLKADILKSELSTRTIDTIFAEVDKFFTAIHKHCLHGDIKARNIMVSRSGTIYIIDFGQALLNNNISEKEQEQLLNLREEEVRMARQTIVYFLQKLQTK